MFLQVATLLICETWGQPVIKWEESLHSFMNTGFSGMTEPYIIYHLVIPSTSELHSPKMHYVIFLEFPFWTLPMLEHVGTLVHHAADSEPPKSS